MQSRLKDLCKLVNDNKLAEIKEIVKQEKTTKYNQWHMRDKDYVEDAMCDAILQGKMDIAEYLLDIGADANGICEKDSNDYNKTAFITKAVQNNNIQMLETLLKHGACIKIALYLAREKYDGILKDYGRILADQYHDNQRKKIIEDKICEYRKQFYDHSSSFSTPLKKAHLIR